MYNHSQTRKKKQLVKYGCRWNAQWVLEDWYKDKINDLLARGGHLAGSKGYIKNYQRAMDKVMKAMSPKKLEQARVMAKEWNELGPPPEIQAK